MHHILNHLKSLRAANLLIGYTSGVFDLLHQGHLNYICNCKKYCDILVLGVDSDERVKLSKGTQRPIQTAKDRINALQEFSDFVFEKELPSIHYATLIKPDVYFFSAQRSISPSKLDQITRIDNYKNIVLLDRTPNHSTTNIINGFPKISK